MTWLPIADEGGSATVPDQSTVRYGASAEADYVERVVSGLVHATNGFFGRDPAESRRKGLWLLQATAVPEPAPNPTPAPAPDGPSLPQLDDKQFADKMRLLEYAQRERSIKANEQLAQASRYVGDKYAELQALLEGRAVG